MLQRRSLLRCCVAPLVAGAMSAPARADQALPPPRGEVILTVAGRITLTNAPGEAQLDRDQLVAWGTAELRTGTPFTDGISTFNGVPVARLLEALGARGTELRARALNDYAVTIPIADVRDHAVLLALEQDGRPLSVRQRGPVWLIYPFSEFPELDDRLHRQRSIWQLTRIEVA
jgi:hypothetical protein